MFRRRLLLLLPLVVLGVQDRSSPAASGDPPRKILILAGPLDPGHPRGTHEYEQSAKLIKHCLDEAELPGVATEVHLGGWPQEPGALDRAETIVLISSGADRRREDHPLLIGDRMEQLETAMRRGCGLVLFHWSVFLPKEQAGDKALQWIGGHFDYESGPPPRYWASQIQTLTTTSYPAAPDHPVCRGVEPFETHEEYYYGIRFSEGAAAPTPVLVTAIPGEPRQTVAWTLERNGGGRGFGFTGGHFFKNWQNENFRRLILNAVLWTAHAPVPEGGVQSAMPSAEDLGRVSVRGPASAEVRRDPPAEAEHAAKAAGKSRAVVRSFAADPDWTPPPARGDAAPWEKETDADWIDDRFRQMDTGPSLNATVQYHGPHGPERSFKGTVIRIGEDGEGAVLFDRNQLRMVAGWTGGYLQHSDRRFGLLNTPSPAGELVFSTTSGPGWANPEGQWECSYPATAPLPRAWARFCGLSLHGPRVVVSYTVGDVDVHESPWMERDGSLAVITRSLEVGPSGQELQCLVAELRSAGRLEELDGIRLVVAEDGEQVVAAAAAGGTAGKAELRLEGERRVTLNIPADAGSSRRLKICLWSGPRAMLRQFAAFVRLASADELKEFRGPGPARWTEPIVTSGELAKDDAAYVVDTLPVPYENPYKALMFLSGLDFLPSGDLAVCTAHGDVWLVQGIDHSLRELTWKRFATGLYQPLGLKVVGGKIHVIERGQLTRLHDFDGNGEADYYENFNNDWHTGGGEHAYDTCLETDPQGNFYFFKTGDTETPTGGCLMRVTGDGRSAEVFATGFRHPIGLSVSNAGLITGADQQGNWMPATRIDIIRRGGFYGDMRAHHRPVAPTSYDPPLCWLPREADNSAGGQVWVNSDRFGPLETQLLHLSYGRCRALLLLPQFDGERAQAGAVDLGLQFLSGVARGRCNPADGQLYVCGLRGWQTAAVRDGCLQRVRYTGAAVALPIGLAAEPAGIRIRFTQPLDRTFATDPTRYRVEQWNYRWAAEYGSKDWSAADPAHEGRDRVTVQSAELSEDGQEVLLRMPAVVPVMQMRIAYGLRTADGAALPGVIWNTIHWVEAQSGRPSE